jgi:hypothetical protein
MRFLDVTHKAAIIEAGTATSLSDATTSLLMTCASLPSLLWLAVKKLQGWSVVAVCNAVLEITPRLMRLLDTNAMGMEQLCRVMFNMQQDFFSYLAKCSNPLMVNPPVSMFNNIIRLVTTSCTASLATLPTGTCWLTVQSPTHYREEP